MTKQDLSVLANLRYDVPASIVVLLVALPLCLGIALASGAPLFSGVIAGVVGGVVIGCFSKSPLSVSGPAAGLTTIVLAAIQSLPSFEAFLLAVFLAGAIQIVLGIARAGVIGDFIPSSVIKGMLAAIGLILILKQIPHAVGYDSDFIGDQVFSQTDGKNTFSAIWHLTTEHLSHGAVIISAISLAFLFWWDKQQPKFTNWLRYVPGPLVVVFFGVAANAFYESFVPSLVIATEHLVAVPVSHTAVEFFQNFSRPDFSQIELQQVWIAAITIALVASIESLLSIEAIDKLDPYKRITPTNRELIAQGIGNMTSGLIGGLPVTSVIVRSSANVSSGARTKLSAIVHGVLLLLCVISIPSILNKIPLSALAAVLIAVGYKLTKPAIFREKYQKGWASLVPFVITIAAILLTDLLIGIAVGVVVGMGFIMLQNFRSAILFLEDNGKFLIRCKKDMFFLHKYELRHTFGRIPSNSQVLIDLSRVGFIDLDNIEIINDFIVGAQFKNIHVTVKSNLECNSIHSIKVPNNETA